MKARIATSAAIVALLVGCSSAGVPSTDPAAACNSAFASAASVDEMHDTVEDLYPAVRACQTIDQWVAAAGSHSRAISAGVDPREFLGNVCTSESAGLSSQPLCKQAIQACTSDPAFADLTYCLVLKASQ